MYKFKNNSHRWKLYAKRAWEQIKLKRWLLPIGSETFLFLRGL